MKQSTKQSYNNITNIELNFSNNGNVVITQLFQKYHKNTVNDINKSGTCGKKHL